jgi:two-component system, NarL family, invasion response regulator UvrY
MKILIADDHVVVRKGIIQIIQEVFPEATIDEASDSKQLISLARSKSYNFIVADLVMPGKNTIEVIKDLKAAQIFTPVIVLSMHPAEQYAVRVLRAGGFGYLTKESAPEELVQAIQTIMNGKKYINSQISDLLLSQFDLDHEVPPHSKLSDREFAVFKLLCEGKSLGAIAAELNLSIQTISTYRARMFEKTGFKSNADLIKYAVSNQIV